MKVMIGGMVNYENNYLITAENFGPEGNLSFSDQLSIILGYVGLLAACALYIMIAINMVSET